MASARPSFTKRQRENAKKERKQLKLEKRAARKENGVDDESMFGEVVAETPIEE
ncbi:MAG TPA: hypothetical protein VM733_04750 [Thermoanaerobaculia bacterium]|nr:hypothetical protein [Thermoanaerobaculia bacterium]